MVLWTGFLTILNIDPHDFVFFSFNFPIFHLAGSLKLASLGLLEFFVSEVSLVSLICWLLGTQKALSWRVSRICLRVSRFFDGDSIPCVVFVQFQSV